LNVFSVGGHFIFVSEKEDELGYISHEILTQKDMISRMQRSYPENIDFNFQMYRIYKVKEQTANRYALVTRTHMD
jgi:hypothetical protein